MAQATLTLHQAEPEADDAPERPRPKQGYFRRAVVLLFLIAALGAWFAPDLIARSGLRHRLVHAVVPAYPGTATVGSASLNWLGPIVLRDLSLTDTEGTELVRLGELRTSKPLASLLFAPGDDLGTVTFVRPEVSVRLRPDGSNLEDAFRPLLDGPSATTSMTVVIEDGRARWTAADGKPAKGGIDALSAKIVRPPGAALPWQGELKGRLGNGEAAGDFSLRVGLAAGESSETPQVSITASELPVGSLGPWLARYGIGATVEGFISANLAGTMNPGKEPSWTADGRLQAQRLWITSPAVPRDDSIRIESLTLTGKASQTDDELFLENVELRSDLGTASASGRFRATALPDGWTDRIDALFAQDARITASADLAKVAAALGRTLRLRQPIESGRLDAELRFTAEEGQRVGNLRVVTKDLVAGPPEQRLTWRDPLAIDLTVRRSPDGLTIDRLRAETDGVTLTGSGSLAGAEVRFDADLDRLRGQLARLVELPDGALSGQATGRITARPADPADPNRVKLDAVGGVRSFSLVLPGRRWSERDLSLTASANLTLSELRPQEVRAGSFALRSVEGDELTASLAGPVALSGESNWPLDVAIKGDVRRWSDRAAAWSVAPLPPGWTADGTLDGTAAVCYSPAGAEVASSSVELQNFRLRMTDRVVDEPYLRLFGSGRWDAAKSLLELSSATFASETASGKATGVRVPIGTAGAASGQVTFRGGAGRIARYAMPAAPPLWLSGVVGGTVDLTSDAGATAADARLEFERPVLTRPVVNGRQVEWRPVWSDERMTANVRARYHRLGDALEVTSLGLSATGLSVEAAGRVDRLSTAADADLSGAVDYDFAVIYQHLAAGLPGGIAASGRSKRPFAVRGPLLSVGGADPTLTASADVGWDEVKAIGLTLGPGEVSARLASRAVTIKPFDWAVAGGHVRAAPTISLEGSPTLLLPAGRVADDIHLTPELSRTWLRYAAPALADSTEVQGSAGLEVAACAVALLDPTQARADAVLLLQGAEATPGPLARSILDAVRQVQTIAGHNPTNGSDLRLVAPAQNVTLKVSGGRVTHDRFLLRVGDENGPTIATAGSVGFDETLDLVADVPLDPKWFKNEQIASALGGQALRVPIRGTLARPSLDPRAFQDLARRAATGAVGGLIDRQIEKQVGDPLRKLLDRGK